MNSNEVRIGNWVSVYGTNGNPKSFVEMQIEIAHLQVMDERPDWFKPIPLTEDWLKRAKLINHENWYEFILGADILVDCCQQTHPFCIEFDGHYHHEVKYVHEMQNIYFDFQKKELEFLTPVEFDYLGKTATMSIDFGKTQNTGVITKIEPTPNRSGWTVILETPNGNIRYDNVLFKNIKLIEK